ncbi:DUF3412 domain-containing protein [Patescibacteria group bacterium]|nr:DUF3412 domain-containing protein [Patescibacteria group bacterium]
MPEVIKSTPAPRVVHEVEVPAAQYLQRLRIKEIDHLTSAASDDFRRCALGIAHTGQSTDNTEELFHQLPGFEVEIRRVRQGISFVLKDIPRSCFTMRNSSLECRENIRQHLSAATRDLLFATMTIGEKQHPGQEATDAVFYILSNAGFFENVMERAGERLDRRRLFAWGGHAIDNEEYAYTKEVGRQLAYQLFEIITGGGPGVMRGTLSGALAGYEAEEVHNAQRFGFNCPSIITSEPPNNMVNSLVILPDIEKRLEAFIRGSLGGVVFPGGAGTAEEILTMLSILLHPKNDKARCPLIFTAPEKSASYFKDIDNFLKIVFGDQLNGRTQPMYEIINSNPEEVALKLAERCEGASRLRAALDEDTIDWHGSLHVPESVQESFCPTHEEVSNLEINRNQPPYELAAQLRKLFSAVVYGNVTDKGIQMIREHGPFEISGERDIMEALDRMLGKFSSEGRMKLKGKYEPCYKLKSKRARRSKTKNT